MTQVVDSFRIDETITGAGINLRSPVRIVILTPSIIANDFLAGNTVDGLIINPGDRILLVGQTSLAENGIYVVSTSGPPSRSVDMPDGEDILGTLIWVREGSNNITGWIGTGVIGVNAEFRRYDVSGPLPPERGGTGNVSFTAGSILVGNGTSSIDELIPTVDSVLITTSGGVPEFNTTMPSGLILPTSTLIAPRIEDTSGLHNYIVRPGILADDREIEIPSLGSDDVLVTESHPQTLRNKNINSSNNTIQINASSITSGTLPVSRGGTGRSSLTSNGFIVGDGTAGVRTLQSVFNATSNPTPSDDINSGYSVGSRWINTSTSNEFVCVNNTAGSAQWISLVSLTTFESTATNTITGNSNTYDVINGMESKPSTGVYFATFSASCTVSNGTLTLEYGIFVDGTLVSHSRRELFSSPFSIIFQTTAMHTQAIIPVKSGQIVDIRYRVNTTSSIAIFNRSLILVKTS